MTGPALQEPHTDEQGLIQSLVRETEKKITQLATEGKQREQELQRSYDQAIEQYEKDLQLKTNTEVRESLSRLEHRHSLDIRRQVQNIIESYIDSSIHDALMELHKTHAPRYTEYLRHRIQWIADEAAHNNITLLIRGDDDSIIHSILEEYQTAHKEISEIPVVRDSNIRYGGIRMYNKSTGVYHDGTLDRAVFRKREIIRSALHRIIHDAVEDSNPETSLGNTVT